MTIDLWLTVPACLLLPYPRNQLCLHITESEKPLLQDTLEFNWKDRKSTPADILSKHWELASIWLLLKPLLFWKGDTSELTTKTNGVTEFQPKRWVLSISLIDHGLIPNPNVAPTGCPLNFWCLFGEVAHIAHITLQKFLIGPFAKMDASYWSRHKL